MTRYLRLLNYENVCKLINFINHNDPDDYACIVVGGVEMKVKDSNWSKVLDYINSFEARYEISDVHPHITNKSIVDSIKEERESYKVSHKVAVLASMEQSTTRFFNSVKCEFENNVILRNTYMSNYVDSLLASQLNVYMSEGLLREMTKFGEQFNLDFPDNTDENND